MRTGRHGSMLMSGRCMPWFRSAAMSDFFDSFGLTEDEELARIHDAGPEGLRQREIAPKFFQPLLTHGYIVKYGPEHYTVSRRGLIRLERMHLLNF